MKVKCAMRVVCACSLACRAMCSSVPAAAASADIGVHLGYAAPLGNVSKASPSYDGYKLSNFARARVPIGVDARYRLTGDLAATALLEYSAILLANNSCATCGRDVELGIRRPVRFAGSGALGSVVWGWRGLRISLGVEPTTVHCVSRLDLRATIAWGGLQLVAMHEPGSVCDVFDR